ncbi:MAG TPA: alpha/beta hydrolase-fold protein [Ktedonosporobacter sp.]|nr:alpha/beta hydrolase-fold protein [Ktedonosporobacter sp.]
MASNSVDTHKQHGFQSVEEDGSEGLPLHQGMFTGTTSLPITPLPEVIGEGPIESAADLTSLPTTPLLNKDPHLKESREHKHLKLSAIRQALKSIQHVFSPAWVRQLWMQRQFVLALLAAFLAGVFLFGNSVAALASIIINVGLDPLRAQLIAALILMGGAALIGSGLGRRRLGAVVGAGIAFYYCYLSDFIQQELKPFHDPGGLLEQLNSQALIRASCMMVALALLCSFIGAAVGANLAEVFIDPFYELLRSIWRFLRRGSSPHGGQSSVPTMVPAKKATTVTLVGKWVGMAMMIMLVILASGSGDLFIFSPDLGLHTPPRLPVLPNTSGTPSTPGATAVPAVSKIVKDSLASPALGGQKKSFTVYLPPSYNTPQGQMRSYPVLYFLHGSPGSNTDGFTGAKLGESADTLIATGKIPELIMILPDGNGRPGSTSEWGNSFDGKQNIETYLVNDLVQYVDQHYRTIPDAGHRAISGISMGGFGAMNIAIHYPDVFGNTIPLGGYYRAEGSIWGNNAAYMRLNSPANTLLTARRAWHLHIFLGAATKDQPYFTYTKQFAQELDQLHIPYTFDLENGYHSWTVWQTQMYKALEWLSWPPVRRSTIPQM